MNVYEESQEGGSAPQGGKADPVKEFKAMPSAERWLAIFALGILVAFVINGVTSMWVFGVFDVCALAGAAAVLALVVPQLFGVRLLTARVRMYTFAIGGVFPAVGFVIQLVSHQIWHAVMLAAGVAMGLTAWQIAERERLLK